MKILVHTSFIGNTGYANHARSFFCALNKYHTVKVRNFSVGSTWKGYSLYPHNNEPYMTDEMKEMLILQTLTNPDGGRSDYNLHTYKGGYNPDIHIVLADVGHPYFNEEYNGYKIAFNVYESTLYPNDFFERLKYFDEVWVPSQWQKDNLIKQGFPKERVSVVNEGVDVETFKPIDVNPNLIPFRFLLFGRWEYRKSTTEIIRAFGETFKDDSTVELICSVENPFPDDGLKTTKERIERDGLNYSNVKFIDFPSREEYIKYLREGDVFVSCSRSEGWNLPLIEAMSCGIPAIYSNCSGQLEFAENKGIPIPIKEMVPAKVMGNIVPGEFYEPDYESLGRWMKSTKEFYNEHKERALKESEEIHKNFNWDAVAKRASDILQTEIESPRSTTEFVFVTTGDIGYMPVIEKLVQSILEFSKSKILVYGVHCEVPFDYPNVIKRRIDPPKRSVHDKWYWKQHACVASLKENYNNFIWIDGDAVINYNFDTIQEHFTKVEDYPLPDIHIQEEFFGIYTHDGKDHTQLFNEELSKLWGVQKLPPPTAHICLYLYNQNCLWWFEEIINAYESIDLKNYVKYFLWNDEGIDNALRYKHNITKHLPLSNFDTSSYDGDAGNTHQTLHQFYKFWNEEGPQNFNRVFGYQYIPKNKSDIKWFHGNKDIDISQKMIDYIKFQRDGNFYQSLSFFTDKYKLEDFSKINGLASSTWDVAMTHGWAAAIFHEIYNLKDYYLDDIKRIHEGDTVVDLGANIGVFSRWARNEGATKIIAFEPDKRYYELLKLNVDRETILFNAAVSDSMGVIEIHESPHLGGSTIFEINDKIEGYDVRTYTLDYLFDTGLVDKIDFLKVDIEGSELMAFDGISDENLRKVGSIGMEYHNKWFGFSEEIRVNFTSRLNRLGFNSHVVFLGTSNELQMIYFYK